MKFKHSRFYISTLLIVTFLLCTAIPDLHSAFYPINFRSYRSVLDVIISTSYHATFVLMFVFYVFLYEPVRQLLISKLSFKLQRKKKLTLPLLDDKEPSVVEEDGQCYNRIQYISTL